MPGDVTVPSTLEGHAAEVWHSAFLSAYGGTCGKREDKDACAAAVAWTAVKQKYVKGDGGKWVQKAEDPAVSNMSALPVTPDMMPGPIEPMLGQREAEGKPPAWKAAYEKALMGECRTAPDPEACARAAANKTVSAVAEEKSMSDFDRFQDYPLAYIQRREFSEKKRERLAKIGAALPGGGFPVENCSDVSNAVQAFGRATNRSATKAHILSRAKSLGCMGQIPDDWKGDGEDGYEARRSLRLQAMQYDMGLIRERGMEVASRPNFISSNVWHNLPPSQRTIQAEALRRITERNYAQATEDAIHQAWECFANPHAPEEFIFQRYLVTESGPVLERAILVRKAMSTTWYLRPLMTFIGASLSVRLGQDEVRHSQKSVAVPTHV